MAQARGAAASAWPGRLSFALALGLSLLLAPSVAAQDDSLEYAVKAAFIQKFGAFVDWPPEAFEGTAGEFRLCVVGENPFGTIIDRTVAGQTIAGRAITVEHMRTVSRGSGCHMLFAGGSEAQDVPEMLAAVRGDPVLTFTDSALTPWDKGIVHFVILDARVRFEIDARQAATNGIMISSKVLSLAVSVTPEG